jgi:hypothetical protein
MIGADVRVRTSPLTHARPPRTIRRSIGGPPLPQRVREKKTAGLFKIAHPSNSRNLSGCIEGKISTRSQNGPSAPVPQVKKVKSLVMPKQPSRCSDLLTIGKRLNPVPSGETVLTPYLWRCIQSCTKTRKNVVLFPSRKRGTVSSRPKHRHDWYKSLAGGFRCACEVWRCEFGEEGKNCDVAAEQGRKYCLAHLASSTQ